MSAEALTLDSLMAMITQGLEGRIRASSQNMLFWSQTGEGRNVYIFDDGSFLTIEILMQEYSGWVVCGRVSKCSDLQLNSLVCNVRKAIGAI